MNGRWHGEYRVNDIWCAAFLDLLHIPLVRVDAPADGHGSTFWYDNTDDQAWKAAQEFRSPSGDMAPIKAFRTSFRRMASASDAARRQGYYSNDNDNR